MSKKLAIFDFDHTLITGDSFWPFMGYVAGKPATYAALVGGLARLALRCARGEKTDEPRTFLKSHLLHRLLAGRKRELLRDAAVKNRLWQTENTPVMRALRDHKDQGHTLVIASGGLDLYLPEMLRAIPHDALICTDVGVENGIVTGEMINGNCVGQRKAERVKEWLAANGPFDEIFAYGNYPHDVPMMELAQHRIIVS